ncbi:MYXO-CTERM sorting domain-containing protein [Streptomyces sp. NPDC058620]
MRDGAPSLCAVVPHRCARWFRIAVHDAGTSGPAPWGSAGAGSVLLRRRR